MIRTMAATARGLLLAPLAVLILSSCGGGGMTTEGASSTASGAGTQPSVAPANEDPCGIEGTGIGIRDCPNPNPPTPNSGPTIADVTPHCAPVGAQAFTLRADTWNLVANSVLRWNGSDLPSTVDLSAGQISAQIPASDIATAGTAVITLFTPGPGGGSSSPVSFPIVTGGTNPLSIAVNPTGRFAYVANQGCLGSFAGSVSMYSIGPSGTLSASGTIAAGSAPISIAIDPLGRFAYVANRDSNDVSTYTMDPNTGVLTPSGRTALGASPWSITLDPSGRFAYLANSLGNDVLMYAIDPNTGALTSMGSTVPETGPLQTPWAGPISVTVDPLGRFAYVAIQGDGGDLTSGSVSVYTINPNTGVLTFTGRAEGSCGASVSVCGPASVAIDRSNKFAVAVGGYGGVSLYNINAMTGSLTSVDAVNAGRSRAVALDPIGKFAYVANFGSNDVSTYNIDVRGGTLTLKGAIPAGSSPSAIAIAPSGEFAYVTNYGSNDVSIYSIDAVTGDLTLIASIGT